MKNYKLKMTCQFCPEQYDLLDEDGNQIAYLRIRHGHFRCTVPEVFGKLVYDSDTDGDGWFTDEERPIHLKKAIQAVHEHYGNTDSDFKYEII